MYPVSHHVDETDDDDGRGLLTTTTALMLLPHGIASVPLDVLNTSASKARSYAVPCTSAAKAPVPATNTPLLLAHASHAATCRVSVLGPHVMALARFLDGTRELEVRIVGPAEAPAPVRFGFSAPVLPHVGIVEDGASSNLYVLVVTATGYLYRLRVPLTSLLHGHPLPTLWAQEHRMAHFASHETHTEATSVHVVDQSLVLVSCADGALVQLTHSFDDSTWRESVLRPSAFSLSRLFSRSATEPFSPVQTLAIATHVSGTDTPLALCVCRDRKLRVWNMATETLVRTLDLPGPSEAMWESTAQPHIQLFYPDDGTYSFYALVYVPTHGTCLAAYGIELEESTSWSGGVGDMGLVWTRPCESLALAPDMELRDMAVVRTRHEWRAWLLWHAGGAPLLQTTLVDGLRASEEQHLVHGPTEDPWIHVQPFDPYTPLHGPALDAALATHTGSAVTALFLERLCEPARFSATTLAAALQAEGVHVAGESLPRILAAIAATIGGASTDAWLRFMRRVEQIDRAARWPLRLCLLDDVPCVVARHTLGVACARGAGAWLASLATRLAAAAPHPDRPSARLAGEAASAEYAFVLQQLTHAPCEAYAPLVDGGASLLQAATLAIEAYDALGARAPRIVDAHAQQGAPLPIPSRVHERVAVLTDQIGGDGLVQAAERLAALYVDDAWLAPAWIDAVTACAHMAHVHARLLGARSLLVLLSLVTQVPALKNVSATTLRAWRSARTMYTLASTSDHEPTLGLVHRALQRGVPRGARVDIFCAAVLPDAPDAVRACLQGDEDPVCVYLVARADALRGRYDDACAALVRVHAALPAHADQLAHVLPIKDVTDFAFWTHAASLVETSVSASFMCYRHAMHALEAGANVAEADARQVWTQVFQAQLALHMYDAASSTVLSLPFDDLRTTCITTLVTTLCNANETHTLLRLDLLDWQPHVERTLSFHARHASPLAHPSYFHILYAYHISRGDYKSAAASMYQHARRMGVLAQTAQPDTMRTYAVRQAQSYLVAINALTLLPPTHAWFAHDHADGLDIGRGKNQALRGRVTQYVPSTEGASPPLAIVQLADVRREYDELMTRLELLQTYPELVHAATPWRAEDALPLFIANDDFDAAWSCAQHLDLPMHGFFEALTQKCVLLERTFHERKAHYEHLDPALQALYMADEEEADSNATFLRHSACTACWPGHAHERAWKYLQIHLEAAKLDDATAYRRTMAETLVALRAWDLAPAWLSAWFQQHAPDVLVRVWMRHGMLEQALAYCAQLVDASMSALRTGTAQPPSCLPYTLMDSLVAAATAQGVDAQALRSSLEARMKALHK